MLLKVLVFSFLILNPQVFFSGGNDGDYYDAYARGADLVTSSIWPDVLRFLNDLDVYTRDGVSFLLMLLGVLFIPVLVAKLSVERSEAPDKLMCFVVLVLVSVYPTLFYYTLDIYRDVFMVSVFLLGLWAVKVNIEATSLTGSALAVFLVLLVGGFLYLLRGYLGASYLGAFLLYRFFNFRTDGMLLRIVLMLVVLNILFVLGYLQPFMKYRQLFDAFQGGSDLGIRFDSAYTFIPDFAKSFSGQFLGLFFPNLFAVILFALESVPAIWGMYYMVRNRSHSTPFIDFIIVFSVMYAVVWLLGNDNLGTAARLRIYNYLGILVACGLLYQRRKRARKFQFN